MSNKTLNTYDRYQILIEKARKAGNTTEQIVAELQSEIKRIEAVCQMKQVELAKSRTPYPAREARRSATECIMVIERIIRDLSDEKRG